MGAIDFWVHIWAQAGHGPGTHPHYGPRQEVLWHSRTPLLKRSNQNRRLTSVSDDRSLYAEVLPSGAIVWRFRYRLNGTREKLTLGKYPALTLKNARLKRDEAAQLVAMGESPAQKKQRDKIAGPEDTTVAQFAERFFKGHSGARPKRQHDASPLSGEGHSSAHWRQPVKTLTPEDLRSVI